jgi:hypothetical protein
MERCFTIEITRNEKPVKVYVDCSTITRVSARWSGNSEEKPYTVYVTTNSSYDDVDKHFATLEEAESYRDRLLGNPEVIEG